MDITRGAVKRVKQLMAVRGTGGAATMRLRLSEGKVYLKWDPAGPGSGDLIVTRRGCSFLIDATTYGRLTDYALDYGEVNGSQRFLLRPIQGMNRRLSGSKTREKKSTGRRKES